MMPIQQTDGRNLSSFVSPPCIRIEACSACQLRCVLCPRTTGDTAPIIGNGFLKFDHFKALIDRNPQIRKVELGNFGEVFLNPDLPKILQYAHENHVVTEIDEGANLNDLTEENLEALVRFQTSKVRCAIDGVTQKTYRHYRVGGDLKKVIRNIQRINALKARYRSARPHLIFQFVVFGHNEHEMDGAVLLAKMLDMEISFKLNFYTNALAVRNPDRVRKYLGYSDRTEYLAGIGRHYMRHLCYEMWLQPQINWDGKLLGCSRNMWGAYAENVFEEDLVSCLNNEKIRYARDMLMGRVPARQDTPCLRCGVYKSIVEQDNWISESELPIHRDGAEGHSCETPF